MSSNGRPDYDAGDLVVCVDDSPCKLGTGPMNVTKGSIYKAVEVHPCIFDDDTEGWAVWLKEEPHGCNANRFRRIDPKPPEFWTGTVDADAGEQVPA